MSKQPRDDANAPIPVLGLKPGGGQAVSISTTTARSTAISNSIRVVTLFSDTDCFIETGEVEAAFICYCCKESNNLIITGIPQILPPRPAISGLKNLLILNKYAQITKNRKL